jgi:hypothetical protein
VSGLTHDEAQNSWPYESNAITIGSGPNRLLVAAVTLNTSSNGVDLSDITADFGTAGRTAGAGTSMTIVGPFNTSGRRMQVVFALLTNPTGAGTVMFNSATGTVTAGDICVYEITGANQTVGTHTAFTAVGGQGQTALATTGTAVTGALLSAVAIRDGDYTSEIAANGGAILDGATNSGGTGFSALTSAFAHELVSAGADGNGFTWTTANDADMATLNIAGA